MKHNESKNNLEYDLLSKGLENLNNNLQLTPPRPLHLEERGWWGMLRTQSPLGHGHAKIKADRGHRTIFDISNSALALASSSTASCPCHSVTLDPWGEKSPEVLLPAALPSWWASPHSRAPRCVGGWGAAGGGSCCWACPGRGGSGAWAAPSAASWRARAAGWRRHCCTCSRDTGTSVGDTATPRFTLFSSHGNRVCPTPARPRLHSPSRSPQVSEMLSHSTALPGLTCSGLVSSDVFGRFEERGDSELPGKEMRLEVAGESVSSFSAWLDDAGRKSGRCNPAARPGQPPEGACWVRVKIHS